MSLPRILVLGSDLAEEMRPIRAALRDWPEPQVRRTLNVDPLAELSDVPDIVVVCQRHPDQFAAADVHRLLARFPLARLICAYGAWCEGDGRNRDVWPGATRVPVAGFAAWWERELRVVGGREAALPLTASRTEVFAAASSGRVPPGTSSVAVLSPDPAWREMLELALRDSGATVVSQPREARTVVWDADSDGAARRQARDELQAGLRGDQRIVNAAGFCHAFDSGPVVWKLAPLLTLVRQIRDAGS